MTVPVSDPRKSQRLLASGSEPSSRLTAGRGIPQGRSRSDDGFRVGHCTTIATEMNTLLEESPWERVSRALLLGALPLSLFAFVAI